jgi:predicted ArsR family transcriptional regulator
MAIADGVRWAVLRELASGQPLSVQDLGARLRRDPNLISKHLRVLRAAGAVVEVQAAGLDGRKTFHTVPEIYRRTDAAGRPMIDYGSCALRFG